MKALAAAIIVGGWLLTSQSFGEDFAGAGIGASSCAVFAQNYAKSPEFSESLYFAWAQGYMTGLNVERSDGQYVVLNAKSVEIEEAEIRSYCDAHPLKDYVDAVTELYVSLPKEPYSKSK